MSYPGDQEQDHLEMLTEFAAAEPEGAGCGCAGCLSSLWLIVIACVLILLAVRLSVPSRHPANGATT
jgi:hypothetical protein